MILPCLLLACPASPARGPFSNVFAIPGGGFFISLPSSSVPIRNSVHLYKGMDLLMCAHLGLFQADTPRWWPRPPLRASTDGTGFLPHRGQGEFSGTVSLSPSASKLYQLLSFMFYESLPLRARQARGSPGHSVRALPPTLPHLKLPPHSDSSDHPARCVPTQAPDAAAVCRPPVLPGEVSRNSCGR